MEVSALVHDTFNVLIEAFIINASYKTIVYFLSSQQDRSHALHQLELDRVHCQYKCA